jgi:predicted nucleotidyltransferase
MSTSLRDVYRLSLQLSREEQKKLAEILLNPPNPLELHQITNILSAHAEELREMGVEQIGVFGSYVHNKADPASDIDLLVKLTRSSFRDFMQLKFYLEDLLARPVDLVLEESLRNELRPTVIHEVVYVKGF